MVDRRTYWICGGLALLLLGAACRRSPANHRGAPPTVSVAAPASSAARAVPKSTLDPAGLLGGPWRLRCAAPSADCVETELTIHGNPATRVIEAVWGKVTLRPGQNTDALGVNPVLVPFAFPAAARLLETELGQETVALLIESTGALGQPAGLRSVVEISGEAYVVAGTMATNAPAVLSYNPDEASWRAAVGRPPPDSEALLALTKLPPGPLWVSRKGLAVEAIWQGTFRGVRERIEPRRLARWPKIAALRRAVSDMGRVVQDELGYSPCSQSLPLWRCEGEGDSTLWLGAVDGKPRLLGWSRPAERPSPATLAATPPATGDADLDAQIARLPLPTRPVLRGVWAKHVPIAVLEIEKPRAALIVFGGGVATLRVLDSVGTAAAANADGPVEARLWDWDRDGREELVVRIERSAGEPWLDVVSLDPFGSLRELGRRSELTFWARDAKTLDAAIDAIDRVPRRAVNRRQAFALLETAGASARSFRKHAAPNAIVFQLNGWYRTGGQAATRADVKLPDQLVDKDVAWLTGLSDVVQHACCTTFECLKDTPHCYCSSRSCGVADGFWFDWQDGRLVIAGAAWPDTD